MDVQESFHMAEGAGETGYAKNSLFQRKAFETMSPIAVEAIQQLFLETTPCIVTIADLGCGPSPSSFPAIKELCHAVQKASRTIKKIPPPELVVYLNDLPTNDFSLIFKALPRLQEEFSRDLQKRSRESASDQVSGETFIPIAAFPGSFYSRVFPSKSVDFIYSCYSLHWLSKVPPSIYNNKGESINKGSIYITKSSPPTISQAYLKQFQEDFSLFLRLRSQELTKKGRMVLLFLGREGNEHGNKDNLCHWQLLTDSFAELIKKGQVEQQKVDSYDVHFYAPSKFEIEEEVRKEGSFILDRLEMHKIETHITQGQIIAKAFRAVQESMISHHFGKEVLEPLFETFARIADGKLSGKSNRPITFIIVLIKK